MPKQGCDAACYYNQLIKDESILQIYHMFLNNNKYGSVNAESVDFVLQMNMTSIFFFCSDTYRQIQDTEI